MQQVTATMPRAQLPSASELQIQNLPPFLALAASADGGREALAKTHVKLAELPFVGETGCFFPSLHSVSVRFRHCLPPPPPTGCPSRVFATETLIGSTRSCVCCMRCSQQVAACQAAPREEAPAQEQFLKTYFFLSSLQ